LILTKDVPAGNLTTYSQFAKFKRGCPESLYLHIITRNKLSCAVRHASAAEQLDCWYRTAKAAQWESLDDIRKTYSAADGIPAGCRVYTVFNIVGNGFRLVTDIYYEEQTILLRHVLTPAEYDRGEWKK
jgi:mRNA interferase HigB